MLLGSSFSSVSFWFLKLQASAIAWESSCEAIIPRNWARSLTVCVGFWGEKKPPHKHNIWQLNGAEESKVSKLSNSGVVKYILLLITCISRHKPLKFQQKLPHRGMRRYFSSTFLCSISLIMFFTPKKVKDGADCICVVEAVERLVGRGLAVHGARVCF